MLLPPPNLFRRRRRAIPPVRPDLVLVTGVILYGEEYLLWTFSATLSSVTGAPPQLEASADGVAFVSPQGLEQLTPDSLLLYYKEGPFAVGSHYRVLTTPAGLTFANGKPLALPQSGPATP